MVRIDMSEYMEKHSVSRLIGAPPGYVGYDEGGQLTEAVRRKPYCVVLFDEGEKANPEAGAIRTEAEEMVMGDLQNHFRPEFLNRLDETILFKPLTRADIGGIVDLLLADVNGRLADRELRISLSDEGKKFVADNGYDPVYAARPLKRYLQKHVETLAARMILGDGVRAGGTIVIDIRPDGSGLTAYAR